MAASWKRTGGRGNLFGEGAVDVVPDVADAPRRPALRHERVEEHAVEDARREVAAHQAAVAQKRRLRVVPSSRVGLEKASIRFKSGFLGYGKGFQGFARSKKRFGGVGY